jgi:hypothetical protein
MVRAVMLHVLDSTALNAVAGQLSNCIQQEPVQRQAWLTRCSGSGSVPENQGYSKQSQLLLLQDSR